MLNPYEKYKQQSVMTMTQGEMLGQLFDETIKQLSGAVVYIQEKDYEKSNLALQKSQKILNYLQSTLNFQYGVSQNLSELYRFFVRQIVQANIKKNAELVEEIIPMIIDLKDTFVQADKLARKQ